MAHLVPSIDYIQELKHKIYNGESIYGSLESLSHHKKSEFHLKMGIWWGYHKLGKHNIISFQSDYQKSLIQILLAGLDGATIYEHLLLLEEEMTKEFERQWKAYLDSLPFKLLIPLLLFFFPSYIILLFGPLVVQFLSGVNS